MDSLKFHPLANVLPLIEGKEFDELCSSVKERGLQDPIILFEEMILDGRNRYRACLKAGVEPLTENFNGGDPVLFILDHNIHRRHLTSSQRAMAIAKYATLCHGSNQWAKKVDGSIEPSTVDQSAKLVGVSPAAVKRAKVVRQHGTAEEIASVMNGKQALSAVANRIRKRRIGHPRQINRKPGRRQKTLLAIFQRGLSLFCNSVESLEEIPIPNLDATQRKEAEKRMKEATKLIWDFRYRIAGLNTAENKNDRPPQP